MALPLAWLDGTEAAQWWLATATGNGGRSRAAAQASLRWRQNGASLHWGGDRVEVRVVWQLHMDYRWQGSSVDVWWQVGPTPFHNFKSFSQPNFEIWICVFPDVQNSPNFAGRHFETQGETLLVGPTSKYHCIASYKFWNQFKFEPSLILEGFKPFWKNPINSLKFHLHMIYLNINLHWLTCIQILEVPLQVEKCT
jgi:hypothetical protein